jgi:Ca2+-binding RTX toxin-like protein
MPTVIFAGEPMNGTADKDLIVDVPGSEGPDSTINGNDGNDLILGDGDHLWFSELSDTNTTLGTAMNIDSSAWSNSSNNPIIGPTAPHTSVYIEPGAGQQRYFAVTVGAGETITLDVDFTNGTGWGGTDTIVDVLDGSGTSLASNDDNPNDFGSVGSFDSRLSYTATVAGTYFIRVREFGSGDGNVFEGGELVFLNVSVTNHSVTAADIAAGNDTISGGLGDDTIFGMLGSDTVHGDDGNDIIASTGDGSYFGDAGSDTIYAGLTFLAETLDGGTGIDMLDTTRFGGTYVVNLTTGLTNYGGESFTNFENLRSGAGNDALTGTGGANTIYGGTGNDTIDGLAGNDSLTGDAGDDIVNGGDGNDNIYDYSGINTLSGGNDNDTISLYMTNGAAAHGDAGTDTLNLYLSVAGAVTINLNGNTTQGANSMVTDGFENLVFAYSYDAAVTASGDNTITTGGGNDTINAGSGNDTISTGAGNDTILFFNTGSLDGGDGVDTVDYTPFGVVGGTYFANLAAGISSSGIGGPYFATYANLENYVGILGAADVVNGTNVTNIISGQTRNDVLSGLGGDDTLNGGDNDDRLKGGGGSDVLNGDAGNDVLDGGAGDDGMIGGLGDDVYYVQSGSDSVVEAGGGGADAVRAAIDYVLAANVEELFIGGSGRDGTGNTLDNILHGGNASNGLSGLAGNDTIRGGDGRDTITGGAGEDLIDGGTGKDTMTGGADRDVFQFRDGDFGATRALADVIADFSHAAAEKIQLNLVDANTIAGGNQAFSWIGNGAFTGVAGQLHYAQAGGNTYVEGDTNGNGTADFVINLTGLINLVASDFVL